MNILKYLIRFCFVLVIFFLSGCASVLSPEKSPNVLSTDPPGAEVFDANNIKLGETPLNLSTIPVNTKELKVKLAGYRESNLSVKRQAKEGILFLDAMLLCIPCPFDLGGDNAYSMYPKNPTLKLRKELRERNSDIKIAIDKVSLDVSNKDSYGRINSSPKKVTDKGFNRIFGEQDFEDEVIKASFNNSYLAGVYAASAENIKSPMERPKVLIKPVIRKIDFDYRGKYLNEFSGKASISIDWKIFKMSDKTNMVSMITTETSIYRNSGNSTKILDQLVSEASLDFLENDTLFDHLKNLEREYLSETKGKEIKISGMTDQKYATVKEALKGSKQAVVTVLNGDGFGSGIIISSDGYIITNYHVVKAEKEISVRLGSEIKMKATLVKSNKDYDLALLKIEAEDLKAISIGNSDLAETGDEVYAIGTPMEESLGQSITKGIISGERIISGVKFIQTDVSINPGNSGGPLINEFGEMIGIATMKISGEGIEGIGFCIPSNSALEMLNIKF